MVTQLNFLLQIFPINVKGAAGGAVNLFHWFGAWTVSYTFNFLMAWSPSGNFRFVVM